MKKINTVKPKESKATAKKEAKKDDQKGNNSLTLFNFDPSSEPIQTNNTINNDNDQQQPKRGSETQNPSVGTGEQQAASGVQSGRVDRSDAGDNGNDTTGNRGVSRSSVGTEKRVLRNQNNNRNEKGVNYAPTSPKARYNANIAAAKLMRQLMEQGVSIPTQQQMETLRKYSGWGGLGTFFNNNTEENAKLREVLSVEEYQAAESNINSAYYTPANIIDSLWDIATKLGFKGGNILESSAGIGNILGTMPEVISEKSSISAVEIDPVSGNILKLLYPDAKVEVKGFEETDIPNGSVDFAITNVPFVTGLNVYDKFDKDLSRQFKNIHDYFIAKKCS